MAMRTEGWDSVCIGGSKSRDGVTCEEWMAASEKGWDPLMPTNH